MLEQKVTPGRTRRSGGGRQPVEKKKRRHRHPNDGSCSNRQRVTHDGLEVGRRRTTAKGGHGAA